MCTKAPSSVIATNIDNELLKIGAMTSEGNQNLKCSNIVDPIDFTHTSIKREDLGMCIIIVTLTKSKGILKNCIFPNFLSMCNTPLVLVFFVRFLATSFNTDWDHIGHHIHTKDRARHAR